MGAHGAEVQAACNPKRIAAWEMCRQLTTEQTITNTQKKKKKTESPVPERAGESRASPLCVFLYQISLRSPRGFYLLGVGVVGGGGVVGAGDHTAPGRQPLSSNPLSDVMTLSNLDHLLKHVPGAVSAAALVSRAPPPPSLPACLLALPNHEPAAGWLLAARRQGQGHGLAAEGDTRTHAQKLSETGARKPP